MKKIVLPNGIQVVVSSWGGVGTTFLLSFISKYLIANDPHDGDGFKHSSLPPISFNPNVKFIYIYGDPKLATKSLFRRGLQGDQYQKLTKWKEGIQNEYPEVTSSTTLLEYIELGVDRLYLREHFQNWYSTHLAHNTLFVRYEAVFGNASRIVEFLGLPSDSILDFPKKKKRKSSLDDGDDRILKGLECIYGAFHKELSELDDVIIREPRLGNTIKQNYCKVEYISALKDQCIMAYGELEDLTAENKSYTDQIHLIAEEKHKLSREIKKLNSKYNTVASKHHEAVQAHHGLIKDYQSLGRDYNTVASKHHEVMEAYHQLSKEHQEQIQKYGVLEKNLFDAKIEIGNMSIREEALSTRIEQLMTSKSWKVTRPLRWLSRKFRVVN